MRLIRSQFVIVSLLVAAGDGFGPTGSSDTAPACDGPGAIPGDAGPEPRLEFQEGNNAATG